MALRPIDPLEGGSASVGFEPHHGSVGIQAVAPADPASGREASNNVASRFAYEFFRADFGLDGTDGLLKYPEGTACAEVLRATTADGAAASSSIWIFRGMAIGAAVKLIVSLLFLTPGSVHALLPVLPKAEVAIELAPALLGVGFILGPIIAWGYERLSRGRNAFAQMSHGLAYGVSIISVAFNVFMMFLELLVAFIQAFVFTFLSAIYFGMAVEEHHKETGHA